MNYGRLHSDDQHDSFLQGHDDSIVDLEHELHPSKMMSSVVMSPGPFNSGASSSSSDMASSSYMSSSSSSSSSSASKDQILNRLGGGGSRSALFDLEALSAHFWSAEGLSMALNAFSAIGIVFVNKMVISTYKFNFGSLLTLIHFAFTSICLVLCAKFGVFTVKPISWRAAVPLSAAFCAFVVLVNLSLAYNSVGFYQIAKIMTTPTIVLIQATYYKTKFEKQILYSLAPICLGVMVATVTDVEMNFKGTLFAVAGIIAASFYQIWVGTEQKNLGLDPMQLLYYQAPLSSAMIFVLLPILEDMSEVSTYFALNMNSQAAFFIFLSAVLAFLVNLSTFLVIGRTSPISYNVLGHAKTCLILVGGFVLFGAKVTFGNLFGIFMALGGVFWYTHLKLQKK